MVCLYARCELSFPTHAGADASHCPPEDVWAFTTLYPMLPRGNKPWYVLVRDRSTRDTRQLNNLKFYRHNHLPENNHLSSLESLKDSHMIAGLAEVLNSREPATVSESHVDPHGGTRSDKATRLAAESRDAMPIILWN